jgi:hypothetical protein
MPKLFSYSFDRETFQGEFDTREQAVDAGIKAAEQLSGSIEAVFVGKRRPVDAQADRHADAVVDAMRTRMESRSGDSSYLAGVNEHILADLDASIEHAIVDWLARHRLAPAARFTAVSEHPMPLVAVHAPNTPGDEVSFIGPDEA